MSKNATQAFIEGLQQLLTHMKLEYNLTLAEAVGCLELIKADLINNVHEVVEDHEEDEDDGE